jgi:hypothetical protein
MRGPNPYETDRPTKAEAPSEYLQASSKEIAAARLSRYETDFQGLDHSKPAALLDRFFRSFSVTTAI